MLFKIRQHNRKKKYSMMVSVIFLLLNRNLAFTSTSISVRNRLISSVKNLIHNTFVKRLLFLRQPNSNFKTTVRLHKIFAKSKIQKIYCQTPSKKVSWETNLQIKNQMNQELSMNRYINDFLQQLLHKKTFFIFFSLTVS